MRIPEHRWLHAVVAGLLLAGCTKTQAKEPEPQAHAPAPAPKPAAPAPAPSAPPAPPPVSDATLSYLEDLPDKTCRWVQHTPPGEPRTFFTLPSPCRRWGMSWRADGREALVYESVPIGTSWDEYRQARATHRDVKKRKIWRVDLVTGKSTSLSQPSRGLVETMGFDAQGQPVAFMVESYEEGSNAPPPALELVQPGMGGDSKPRLRLEGQLYDLPDDAMTGSPGLAHAFRLDKKGKWTRFETKGTAFGMEESLGIEVLDAWREVRPSVEYSIFSRSAALADVPEDSPDFAALSAVLAPSNLGGWKQLETSAGPLYVYLWKHTADEGEEPLHHVGLVRIRGDAGLVEPEGLSFNDELLVSMRGDQVLLRSAGVARLWNAKTKKLLASFNHHVIFWPLPSSPQRAPSEPPHAEPPVPPQQRDGEYRAPSPSRLKQECQP